MFNSHYKLGCDAHKHFSLFAVRGPHGQIIDRVRVNHYPGAIQSFLSQFPEGTPVALETVGNWYWIVDEIEASGCIPLLAHAHFAKKMMAHIHKTDKLDADGLATLLHNGTLPAVWIPPGDLRDERELPRTRMAFSRIRTMLKNRTHSTLAKYNLSLAEASDIFTPKWRLDLLDLFNQLPPETARCARQQLELLDTVQDHIDQLEARILTRIKITASMQLIQTVPGPAKVLAIVIDREVGSIDRFPAAKNFTGYCGLVPKVKASAGRAHYGRLIKQCNTYLKWAFIEAANVIVRHRHHPNWRENYVSHLYERIKRRKGHSVAVGATARYLAEATYWVLTKEETYKEPPNWRSAVGLSAASPSQRQART